jgi:hypothetical protein
MCLPRKPDFFVTLEFNTNHPGHTGLMALNTSQASNSNILDQTRAFLLKIEQIDTMMFKISN